MSATYITPPELGSWSVDVDYQDAHIENLRSGETFTAGMHPSLIGYRIGKTWTNGLSDCTDRIPAHVRAKAAELASSIGFAN